MKVRLKSTKRDKEANKHAYKKLKAGCGTGGKTTVARLKDHNTGQIRAEVVADTSGPTLKQFVYRNSEIGTTVYTDDATAYKGVIGVEHETVKHSVGEWGGGVAHTSGLASFWATLKRAYLGVYHKMPRKHLQRYVRQFAQKHNVWGMDTREQMQQVVTALVGRRLVYKDLIAKCARTRIRRTHYALRLRGSTTRPARIRAIAG